MCGKQCKMSILDSSRLPFQSRAFGPSVDEDRPIGLLKAPNEIGLFVSKRAAFFRRVALFWPANTARRLLEVSCARRTIPV